MNTKEEIKRVVEKLGCHDYTEYSFDELMEQYDTLKALHNFENTPSQFVESPRKKAKEIALDAAIKSGHTATPENVVKCAEVIYQWLITYESKQQ